MTSRWIVPAPPAPSALKYLAETWKAGLPLIRCHPSDFGATEFNPGDLKRRGRFSPFPDSHGQLVPFLYGADSEQGALSETVFHDIPVRGAGRIVFRSHLRTRLLSTIAPRRDLRLVQLHGHGLRRLQVSRAELIESEADQYEKTAAWAQALYAGFPEIDGLVWMSRQHDSSRALILFKGRVGRNELEVVEAPLPLYVGSGLEKVQRAADQADITFVD